MITLISNSENETKEYGNRLAKYLKKGDVIVLTGDLGAGKTMFTTGLLSYWGKEKEASSPTFTIVNEHQLTEHLKLFHFDVYRFDFEDEFLAIGGEEFFQQGICLIEWGEKINHYLPKEYIRLTIEKENIEKRRLTFDTTSERYQQLLEEAYKNS